MKKLFIKTYGCQMNVYDSERMYELLAPHGYKQSDDYSEADVIILNTCHIREKAAEKIYSELGRIVPIKKKLAKKGKKTNIVVAGCVAQAEGSEIINRQPFVDIVVGPQTYHKLPEFLSKIQKSSSKIVDTNFPVENKFDTLEHNRDVANVTSFLSIQEGCDKFCSFCVVPYTRGLEYSRPVIKIIEEAKILLKKGAKEICLLGQNVNAYSFSYNKKDWNLARLLRELAGLEGIKRLRYMTSHPVDMNDDLIKAHGEIPFLMPYLHLPIQSGDDDILKKMNRGYDVKLYLDIISKLKNIRDDIAFSSDFIVGFPGETDKAFNNTLELVKKVNYAQAYSFKYSRRPGTPGSIMKNQINEQIKTERLSILQQLLNKQQIHFNNSFMDNKLEVLAEKKGKKGGQLVGKSPYLQSIYFNNEFNKIGDLVKLKIISTGKNSLEGKLINSSNGEIN